MIYIKNLTKKYPGQDKPVLDNVNLTLPDRGLVYLVGKSGAGKSTLFNLLGAMDETYSGSILVDGKELKSLSEKERAYYRYSYLSFAFQSYSAQEKETVKANLLKALAISSLTKKEKEARIKKRLKQVRLLDKEVTLFKNLSGGEKKRISLCRALLKESPLLLADEPLSSLNDNLRKAITSILIQESKSRLVFIITHEKGEIPHDAILYELNNGKINLLRRNSIQNRKFKIIKPDRRPFKGAPFLFQLIDKLKSKRQFISITIFALLIALFSISFSFQLSGSVSSSMKASMESYMDENSLVISNRDEGIYNTHFESADYNQLLYLKQKYQDEIIDTSTFYLTGFDTLFRNNQSLQALYQDKVFTFNKLSLNSFLEYRMMEEVEGHSFYGDHSTTIDEVILSLDENNMAGIYMLLFNKTVSKLTTSHLIQIDNALKVAPIPLRIKANKGEWGYEQDYSYKIKAVTLSNKCFIINSSNAFANHFVTDVMHFKEVLEEEPFNESIPWTLKKSEGLRLYPSKIESFLRHFLFEKNSQEYTLKLHCTHNYYDQKDLSTHNHIIVYRDYLPKINLSQFHSFELSQQDKIQSIRYSSPVYTYTASGYISGFSRPYFFSKYKEKLNQIQDSAMYADQNLGSFQGSLIEDVDGVIKADLISSMDQKNGLKFISLEGNKTKPFYGREPQNIHEIAISKRMAIELFHSCTAALNAPLCILALKETQKINDRYINTFVESEITISGIYENESIAIYHDTLFPLLFCFLHNSLSDTDFRINQVIASVDITNYSLNYYLDKLSQFGDFIGVFTMYNIISEIKKTLNFLSQLFLGFAILSLLVATCLLFLSMYLILSKEKKDIGILLSLGYQKNEIATFYFSLCLSIGLISYILSLFLSISTEIILQNTLEDMLQAYQFSLLPYLISAMTCFLLTSIIGFIFSLKCKSLSPKDAFDRSHR